jgi:hypothetical protein
MRELYYEDFLDLTEQQIDNYIERYKSKIGTDEKLIEKIKEALEDGKVPPSGYFTEYKDCIAYRSGLVVWIHIQELIDKFINNPNFDIWEYVLDQVYMMERME